MIRKTLLMVSIFLISCNSRTSSNYKIELVSTLQIIPDSLTEQSLTSVYPFAAGANNSNFIAISNYRNPVNVVIFNYDGKFISKVGNTGRGPSEIQSARFFGFDQNDDIIIYDKTLASLKKFSLDNPDSASSFGVHKAKTFDIFSNIFERCHQNWVLAIHSLNTKRIDSLNIVGIFDDSFKLIQRFGDRDPFLGDRVSVLHAPVTSIDCENAVVYTSHGKIPFIQSFDVTTGAFLNRSREIPPSFKLSDKFISMVENINDMRDFMINKQSGTKYLFNDERFVYLIFRNDSKKFYETGLYWDREFYLAVFSKKNLEFLGEAKIVGAPLGTTNDKKIISINGNSNRYYFELIEVIVDSLILN